MPRLRWTAFLIFALVLPVLPAWRCHAQSAPEGVLNLTVVDPTGAKVPRADVGLSNNTVSLTATTDTYGRAAFTVAAGGYDISVDADGFSTLERKVRIESGRSLDLVLKLSIEPELVELNIAADTDPGANRSAVVMSGDVLSTLSDDEETFQKQILGIAGANGPFGAQVYVDGFSNGTFPPKSSIREVRINENTYSAEYDHLGYGRVEITTKPGGNKLHGQVQVSGNDAPFNARNPYTGLEPPYYAFDLDGNISGPLTQRASFFLAESYNDRRNNTVINAQVLDAGLAPAAYSAALPNPMTTQRWSPRVDVPLSANDTLTARYDFTQTNLSNGSVGLLVLGEQGYASGLTSQTLQVSDSHIFPPHTILESRFQYKRLRLAQGANSNAPTLIVSGAFGAGGNPQQTLNDKQDSYEGQEYLSIDRGRNFLHLGGRGRVYRESNVSTANYNGQFVFNSLAAYQLTLQGLRNGQTGAEIRASGGGASQYSLTAGQPGAAILTADVGLFADDDWHLRDNLTLSLGVRFESQTAIPDHLDPAPRLGLSWGIGKTAKRDPILNLRGGFGLFYDRFPALALLTTKRQNGVSQQSYFVSNPDTYPSVPTASLAATPTTVYSIDPHLRSEYDLDASVAVDRSLGVVPLGRLGKLPLNGSISATYVFTHGVHQFLSRNINAPLPSGATPNGTTQALYQFDSQGVNYWHTFSFNLSLQPARRVQLWGFGSFQRIRADSFGINSFPSNQYDLAQDYGYYPSAEEQMFGGGTVQLPFGLRNTYFVSAQSGQRFNITTGTDLNGDTIYNDRPAFATDLTRPTVVRTRYGNFDTQPIASEKTIPVNYGQAPRFFYLMTSLGRSWRFGPLPPVPPGSKKKPVPPYRLAFTVEADNALNTTNPGLPSGVIGQDATTRQPSPTFGRSLSTNNQFGGNPAANRMVTLRTTFNF